MTWVPPTSITGKTCPLRKTCDVCGGEYGRNLMASGKGRGHFVSVKLFAKRTTCSRECGKVKAGRTQSLLHKDRVSPADAIRAFIGV